MLHLCEADNRDQKLSTKVLQKKFKKKQKRT